MFLFKTRFSGPSAAREAIERGRAAVLEGAHAAVAAAERLEASAMPAPRRGSNHRTAITVAAVTVTAVAATAAYVWWRRRSETRYEMPEAGMQAPWRTTAPAASSPAPEPVATTSTPDIAPSAPWPTPAAPWAAPAAAVSSQEAVPATTGEAEESAVGTPVAPMAATGAPTSMPAQAGGVLADVTTPTAPTNPWGVAGPPMAEASASVATPVVAAPAVPAPSGAATTSTTPPVAESIPAWLAPSAPRPLDGVSMETSTAAPPVVAVAAPEETAAPVSEPAAMAAPTELATVAVVEATSMQVAEPVRAQAPEDSAAESGEPEVAPSTTQYVPAPAPLRLGPAEEPDYAARRAPTRTSSSPFGQQFAAPTVRTVLPSRGPSLP
jgi:hypothetical protein